MTATDWADTATAEYRTGRSLTLLFDYDGTLTPIVSHPTLAVLPTATRDALAVLAALPRVTVGVVSGRGLPTLRGLIGLPALQYAGSGGMHLDIGDEEVIDPAVAEFDRIADALIEVLSVPVRWFPGAWVERKPGCLSVHYRQLTPLKTWCFLKEARDALAEFATDCPPLRIRDVTRALEVTLAAAWTKGDAVRRIVACGAPDPFVVFAGDGANDEEAVAAVNACRGLTIGVGPEAPDSASLRVADQAEFEAGLFRLVEGMCSDGLPGSARGQSAHASGDFPAYRGAP